MSLTNVWHGMIRHTSRRGMADEQRQCSSVLRLSLEPLEDRSLLSSYTITDLGTVFAYGLNNASAAQVVGTAGRHAFLWDATHGMQDLGTSSQDNESAAYDVNDSGQVTGISDKVTEKYDKRL